MTMTLFPVDVAQAVPGKARRRGPETSKKAARTRVCTITWGSHRARLLIAFQEHGSLTDPQAAAYAKIDRVAATRRLSEMRSARLILPTGQKRKTSSDVEAMVCGITDEGRKALHRAYKAVKK